MASPEPQRTAILSGIVRGLKGLLVRLGNKEDVSSWLDRAVIILSNEEIEYAASSNQTELVSNMTGAITAIIGELVMPLEKSGNCKAFWSNYKHLVEKFKGEGADEGKARSRAIAAASRVSKENGGTPSECLKNKKE